MRDRLPSLRSRFARAGRLLFTLAVLAVLIGAAVGFSAVASRIQATEDAAEPETPPLLVDAARFEPVDSYVVETEYVGEVEPRRRADIGFELGGLVAEVMFNDGDRVEQGEAVARLDTERLRAERDVRMAQAEEAEALAELAQLTLTRTRRAFERNATNEQSLDEAIKNAAAARAAAARASAGVRSIEVDIAKSTLRAPFDAIVAARIVDEGRVLAAGSPVYELLEAAPLEARIGVPPQVAERLEVGSEHTLRIRGGDHSAMVKSIIPTTAGRSRTVEIVFGLDVLPPTLRAGDKATVKIERTIQQRGAWVPRTALTDHERGLWALFTIGDIDEQAGEEGGQQGDEFGALGKVRKTPVEVLETRGDDAFVRGAVKPGDVFVPSGVHRLVTGMPVRLPQRMAEAEEAAP